MFLKHLKWALLWALLILILCAIPGKDIPFGGFWDLFNLDKLIHASVFFIQAILLIQGFNQQNQVILFKKSPKVFSVILCIFYGGDLELMQGAFFHDRSADVYDFIANSFGAFTGALFFEKILNKYKYYFEKKSG